MNFMRDEYYISDDHYKIAESNGICANTLYARVNQYFWPIQKAIKEPVLGRDPVRTHWRNMAARNGISRHLFNSRVAEGWGYERAATEPKHDMASITRNANKANLKVFTPEQVEIMKANGIKHSTAYGRVYHHEWDPQDAVTMPVGSRNPNRKKKYKPMLQW